MPGFKLINPLIVGEFGKQYEAASPEQAAANTWSALSKHIIGNVPQMGFTLQRGGDNKLFHFIVRESGKGKNADFSITPLQNSLNAEEEKKMIDHVEKIQKDLSNRQTGGKDDSSSSSSSDDDSSSDSLYDRVKLFHRSNYTYNPQTPIVYWWYSPLVYQKLVPTYTSLYVPTFTIPLRPYVEIDVSSAFFG